MKYLLIIILFVFSAKNGTSQIMGYNMYMDTVNNINYYYNSSKTYENYTNDMIFFPEIINPDEKTYSLSDSLFLSAENLENIKLPKKVSDDIFNILFGHDIVNAWEFYDESGNDTSIVDDMILPDNYKPRYKNREVYLRKAKSKFKMYFLGNVEINKNFSSKLVMVHLKDKFQMRNLFLVNVKDDRLKSITIISSCFYPEKKCCCSDDLNLKLLGNGIFTRIGGLINSGHSDYVKELEYCPIFYYDDEGYAQTLKDCYIVPWLISY